MLEWATRYFTEKQIPSPRLSIEWIVAEALGMKRLDLYLQFDRPLTSEQLDVIRPMVKRRAAGEPVQYIIGQTDFMSCTFRVTPDVLIPRVETEQLVELILERSKERAENALHVLDIGTGSGCIPISLKKERPVWACEGVDISAAAIEIANENARFNETQVSFFEGDILKWKENPVLAGGSWDLVISNPPYITEAEKPGMEKQVLEFEPALALFHNNPVLIYKEIAAFSAVKKARLFLEINNRFAAQIKEVVSGVYEVVNVLTDLDGNERFIEAARPF